MKKIRGHRSRITTGWDNQKSRSKSLDDYKVLKKFKKAVRARDKTCRMPGCKSKEYCQVHHILRWADCPRLRYEPKNGILLCKSCHNSIKGKESNYIELFLKIVERSYDNN